VREDDGEACFLVGARKEVSGSSRRGESVAIDAKSMGEEKRSTWLNMGRINGVKNKGNGRCVMITGVWFPCFFNTYHIKCLDTCMEC
jgi:hypothetical protein